MNAQRQPESLPAELQSTYRLVSSAFPCEISEGEYKALLSVLVNDVSFRALARVISSFTGKQYELIYNDILGVGSPYEEWKPQEADLEKVRKRLAAGGYDEWLTEAE